MKKMMKLFTILLVSFLAFGALTGCQNSDTPHDNDGEKVVQADMSAYEELKDKEHVYVEVRVADVLEALKNEEGERKVFYLGFVGCPWCMEIVPVLNEVAKQEGIDTVYYLNTRDVTDEENADFEQVKALMSSVLAVNADGNPVLYVPDIMIVEKGQILVNHIGTVDSHNAHERTMTEEEMTQLKAKLVDELHTEYVSGTEGLVEEEVLDETPEPETETE